ncbi:MAG: primase, partial [Planctomycetota bacterium]
SSSTSDRDRVLAATDILSVIGEVVALRPKGREHVGLCPFHDDRSPSMAVVTHKSAMGGTGFYKCFACGAAGNAIDFVINYHRMEFPEALRFLAARAGIELTPFVPQGRPRNDGEPTRDDILRANALAEKFFRRVFADTELGAKARAEATRRGYDEVTIDAFGLGAAPAKFDALADGVRRAIKNAGSDYPSFDAFVQAGVIRPARSGGGFVDLLRDRLVFPICDDLGRPIAFGGRKLDPEQEPKYLNSPESPVFHKSKALYGIHRAKRKIVEAKTAIITEGYTDVIACHRAGFTNTVATLGTALTREHARMLRRLCDSVVLLFDGDEAGQKAADRALEVFFSESIDIKICVLPDNLDPDDLLRQEGGSERFRLALDRSADALTFMASRIRRQLEGRGLSGRQQMIEQTTAKFVDLGLNAMGGLRRQLVMQMMADLFGLGVADLDRLARSLKPRPTASAAGSAEARASDEGPRFENGSGSVGPNGRSGNSTMIAVSDPSPADRFAFPGSAARLRARLHAERRLLGVLCCDPALASVAVPVSDAGHLPLSEAISPQEFADAGHAAIFAAIRNAAEDARVLNFDGLIGELADGAAKRLASDLYLFGTEVLRAATTTAVAGGARTAADELVVSWCDLENLERRERFRNGISQNTTGQKSLSPADNSQSEEIHAGSSHPAERREQTVDRIPPSGGIRATEDLDSFRGDGLHRTLDLETAAARLAQLRERGHDATAASTFFQRRSTPAKDSGRSSTP